MLWLRKLERPLLLFGLLMLAIYFGARIHGAVLSRSSLQSFHRQQLSSARSPSKLTLTAAKPDFSLWSPERVQEYEDSFSAQLAPAIGILRIPKIHVEVPVLEGTDDLTLNRGVGRIAGTARLGEDGNVGIAGHRDGFFRGLKDISPGDTIELVSPERTDRFVVDEIKIVGPKDVSVLDPRSQPTLTLVTCYPFYYVGSAPQRYIVQASIATATPTTLNAQPAAIPYSPNGQRGSR